MRVAAAAVLLLPLEPAAGQCPVLSIDQKFEASGCGAMIGSAPCTLLCRESLGFVGTPGSVTCPAGVTSPIGTFPECAKCTSSSHCNSHSVEVYASGGRCVCVCSDLFAGDECQHCRGGRTNYPSCSLECHLRRLCSGHGLSIDVNGTCECRCAQEYRGVDCEECAQGRENFPACTVIQQNSPPAPPPPPPDLSATPAPATPAPSQQQGGSGGPDVVLWVLVGVVLAAGVIGACVCLLKVFGKDDSPASPAAARTPTAGPPQLKIEPGSPAAPSTQQGKYVTSAFCTGQPPDSLIHDGTYGGAKSGSSQPSLRPSSSRSSARSSAGHSARLAAPSTGWADPQDFPAQRVLSTASSDEGGAASGLPAGRKRSPASSRSSRRSPRSLTLDSFGATTPDMDALQPQRQPQRRYGA
eukprot:TRINITY_DN1374_c1_g1_i1.p1 TRINITY_DN1374_c1_g1~~TRINITY_DN1374_c1_g1_i1.p1  ORF type:complete len:412 (+),score=119.29 TRINITY_DN1374_c1_g1_i1:99-1334(+)